MKATMVIIFMFAMILGVSNPALAWTEDFDSYAAGSGIIGQGGWDGWDGDPIWEAYVSDDQSLSSPNSLRLDATSDVVQQFSGFNSGQYQISAWQYFPSTATGYQYFILLNTYNQGGPYNWSTQIEFGDGVVFNYVDSIELPLLGRASS